MKESVHRADHQGETLQERFSTTDRDTDLHTLTCSINNLLLNQSSQQEKQIKCDVTFSWCIIEALCIVSSQRNPRLWLLSHWFLCGLIMFSSTPFSQFTVISKTLLKGQTTECSAPQCPAGCPQDYFTANSGNQS